MNDNILQNDNFEQRDEAKNISSESEQSECSDSGEGSHPSKRPRLQVTSLVRCCATHETRVGGRGRVHLPSSTDPKIVGQLRTLSQDEVSPSLENDDGERSLCTTQEADSLFNEFRNKHLSIEAQCSKCSLPMVCPACTIEGSVDCRPGSHFPNSHIIDFVNSSTHDFSAITPETGGSETSEPPISSAFRRIEHYVRDFPCVAVNFDGPKLLCFCSRFLARGESVVLTVLHQLASIVGTSRHYMVNSFLLAMAEMGTVEYSENALFEYSTGAFMPISQVKLFLQIYCAPFTFVECLALLANKTRAALFDNPQVETHVARWGLPTPPSHSLEFDLSYCCTGLSFSERVYVSCVKNAIDHLFEAVHIL